MGLILFSQIMKLLELSQCKMDTREKWEDLEKLVSVMIAGLHLLLSVYGFDAV